MERYDHQSPTSIPPKPTKKRTISQSSAQDEKVSDAPPIQTKRSAAPQDIHQRALSPHSVPPAPLSTPPLRPFRIKDLLNPISGKSASGREHDGEGTDSLRTAPALPYPLANIEARQSPFGHSQDHAFTPIWSGLPQQPLETATAGSTLLVAHTSSAPPPHQHSPYTSPYPLMPAPVDPFGNLIALNNPTRSQHSSPTLQHRLNNPPSALPQVAYTGGAHSSSSASFAAETLDTPTSGSSGQNPYQMMTLATERGLIQVPCHMQATSEPAREKRRRNAEASHNFRQRRKERDEKNSNTILRLQSQVKQIERQRDNLRGVLKKHHIPIPPPPPAPLPISLGGWPHQDAGTST